MSVLSREELRAAIAAQPPLVEGIYPQMQLQPNGIDLRVDRIQRLTSPGLLGAAPNLREPAAREDVQLDADGWWDLHQGSYVIGYAEKVNLPPDRHGARAANRARAAASSGTWTTFFWARLIWA